MISILIVDDQPTVRRGLRMRLALEHDMQIVGEAENGEVALRLAQTLHPTIVLMDVEMPRLDGIATTAALRDLAPDSAVIMLSVHCDRRMKARAREAGAVAYLEKHTADAALLDTIRQSAPPDRD